MTEAAIINVFSRNLRLIIQTKNKQLIDIATRCGISERTMIRLANGNGHPSIKTLEKLTDGLCCTVGELYGASK